MIKIRKEIKKNFHLFIQIVTTFFFKLNKEEDYFCHSSIFNFSYEVRAIDKHPTDCSKNIQSWLILYFVRAIDV
jgi:hypothetical protein